jgi:hypothetical protein
MNPAEQGSLRRNSNDVRTEDSAIAAATGTFNPLVAGSNPARPTTNKYQAHEFTFVGFLLWCRSRLKTHPAATGPVRSPRVVFLFARQSVPSPLVPYLCRALRLQSPRRASPSVRAPSAHSAGPSLPTSTHPFPAGRTAACRSAPASLPSVAQVVPAEIRDAGTLQRTPPRFGVHVAHRKCLRHGSSRRRGTAPPHRTTSVWWSARITRSWKRYKSGLSHWQPRKNRIAKAATCLQAQQFENDEKSLIAGGHHCPPFVLFRLAQSSENME